MKDLIEGLKKEIKMGNLIELSTEQEIIYLENLLEEIGCPLSEITPNAMQLLKACKEKGKHVFEMDLNEM